MERSGLPLALLLTVASCAPPMPPVFHGNIGGVRYDVPSAVLMVSLRYEGEDDWHPIAIPWRDRGYADRIAFMEFWLNLDDLSRPADRMMAARASAERPPSGQGLYGPWVGLTASAAHFDRKNRSDWLASMIRRLPADRSLFTAARPLHGLTLYELSPEGRRLWRVASVLLDRQDDTWILCNDDRMVAPPHADIATCGWTVVDHDDRVILSGTMDRARLADWRALASAATAVIRSWRTEP